MRLLLGSEEYLRAINHDFQFGFGLKNNKNFYRSEEIVKIIDEFKQFNSERNTTFDYVLYGKIENLIDEVLGVSYNFNETNYTISVGYIDRILPLNSDMIDIIQVNQSSITLGNSSIQLNDIILVYINGTLVPRRVLAVNPLNEYILDDMYGLTTSHKIVPSIANYQRHYKEIINTDYIKIFNSAFSTNIFTNEIFQYNTFKNINVNGLLDNLNIPVTNLIMKLKPKFNYSNTYKSNFNIIINDETIVDTIVYDLNNLNIEVLDKIQTTFLNQSLNFYFNPYIEFPFRTVSSVVNDSNIENLFDIPNYGFKFNNGDIFFKQVLEIGEFENGVGLDYPFINNLHYLYKDVKFFIRRVVPIANYDILLQINNDQYADDLINDNVTKERLC